MILPSHRRDQDDDARGCLAPVLLAVLAGVAAACLVAFALVAYFTF